MKTTYVETGSVTFNDDGKWPLTMGYVTFDDEGVWPLTMGVCGLWRWGYVVFDDEVLWSLTMRGLWTFPNDNERNRTSSE